MRLLGSGVAWRRVCVGVLVVAGCVVVGPGVAFGCPNERLRIEDRSTALPDCRAYELVSPAEKDGGSGDVLSFESETQLPNPMQAAPMVSPAEAEPSVLYSGEQFYQPLTGSLNEYVSRRSPSGWGTTNLTPAGGDEQFRVIAASEGLKRFVIASEGPTYREPDAYRSLYIEEAPGVGTRPLFSVTPSHRTPNEFGFDSEHVGDSDAPFVSASTDLSRVYFEANDALLEGVGGLVTELNEDVSEEVVAAENGNYIYEWNEGKLALAGILPDGKVARHASLGEEYGGAVVHLLVPNLDHAVSDDGSEVFWSNEENGTHALYVREDGVHTTQVDASVGGSGEFLAAAPDGSRAFFSKEGTLYEYVVGTHETIDISKDSSGKEDVQGLVGTSKDGEYVYFVATGELTSAPNGRGQTAVVGGDNLYVYEPQPGQPGQHTTRFITTLESGDDNYLTGDPALSVVDWGSTVGQRTAEVSPNGLFVAFGSHTALTGVVNSGPEIYLYSLEAANHGVGSGELVCASCDPSGASNKGAYLPGFTDVYGTHEQRYVLNNGMLFFTTTAGLVPQDTNGLDDVYEWEDGAPHLISPGTSESPAVFADATVSGSDAFFTTAQPLVTQDQDQIVDLYDAKVEGGQPAVTIPTPCTTSEGCGQQAPQAPAFQAPASTTLTGQGNLPPPPPPSGTAQPKKKTTAQLRAEELAKALRACKRDRTKKKRAACDRRARRLYGARTSTSSRQGGRS
jgi:hypothetical protein